MDIIRMDLKEISINTKNWVVLDQDKNGRRALAIAALSLQVL